MIKRIFFKIVLALIIALTLNVKLLAVDQIIFTWQFDVLSSTLNKRVKIRAIEGESFTVNWGDNSEIVTKIGAGDTDITLIHTYTSAEEYTVTITASSSDCRFTLFDCYERDFWNERRENNLISSLIFSDRSALTYLDCSYNLLTDLDLLCCTNLSTLICGTNQLTNLD